MAKLEEPTSDAAKADSPKDVEMRGFLQKWANCMKGYQRRWFVLSGGVLSYYRKQDEKSEKCRGAISMHGALIKTTSLLEFVVEDGESKAFHMKADCIEEREDWVTALKLAKSNSEI